MARTKYCKCSHREDQHLPDTVKRQGSKEEWNTKIKYKGQCAVCDTSGVFACLKFREKKENQAEVRRESLKKLEIKEARKGERK